MKFDKLVDKILNEASWGYEPPNMVDMADFDEPEQMCEHCGEPMEWEQDADYDPETGRAVASGGGWVCLNKDCCG